MWHTLILTMRMNMGSRKLLWSTIIGICNSVPLAKHKQNYGYHWPRNISPLLLNTSDNKVLPLGQCIAPHQKLQSQSTQRELLPTSVRSWKPIPTSNRPTKVFYRLHTISRLLCWMNERLAWMQNFPLTSLSCQACWHNTYSTINSIY